MADSEPEDVNKWFFINPTSGGLSVISNIREDQEKRTVYKVSKGLRLLTPLYHIMKILHIRLGIDFRMKDYFLE